MGNLIPLDGAKKEQCEEIAKEFLATFSTQYVLAYGVEFIKMKMKQIENEAYGEAKIKKELMYRKNVSCTDPHKMGPLTKKGAIIKSWKHRYFVVNPDFSVSYYETEEAYHKNSKPKGVIHLAGYEVAESADNAKIEQLKALAKTFGVDEESLPLPHKFPPHTLALFHERRRDYFITATDEEDKKDWVQMFRTCCRKTKGFKNKDPVAQAAFKTAYRRACYESSWYRRSDPCGGTEEQVLSETLVEIINDRVLSSVYSDLTGNYMIRKKVRHQVMKTLDSMVLAMVVPAYKGLVETTEKMKEPFEKTFNEKKDEIVEVQKKITQQLAEKIESILKKAFEEMLADMKKLYEDLKELTRRTSAEMRNECVVRLMERMVKDTKGSQDVAGVMKKYYRIFDGVTLRTSSWDHWYKVYNIEKEAIGIINRYKETFEIGGEYSYVYASHDMLAKVADAAFYTFEQILEERTKETDILKDNNKAAEMMGKVKDDVIPKYDADSKHTPHEVSFKLTTTHIVEYVSKKIDPLTKDILKIAASAIPEPLKQLISIQERYELYIKECVKELIRRAIGIAKPQQNGEVRTEECETPENGEMRKKQEDNETEKVKENELEDQKVEENGEEGSDVQENGETAIVSSEKKNESEDQKVERNGEKGSEVQENGETTAKSVEKNENDKTLDEELKENESTKDENIENENIENGETAEKCSEEKQDNDKEPKLQENANDEENGQSNELDNEEEENDEDAADTTDM